MALTDGERTGARGPDPAEQGKVRFIHTGDWQLGMTRRFLSAEAQARFTEARLEAVRATARLARDERCAFVVVCGDVFESNQVAPSLVARACDALSSFDVPVYLLPGNHDPLDGGSVFRSPTFISRQPPNVHVLEAGIVPLPGSGVELAAAPWSNKRPLEDLAAAACAALPPPEGTRRVLVAHGAVDTLAAEPANPALIRLASLEEALRSGLIHYAALGDRHSLTGVGASGRVWYAGSPLATDFREERPNHVLLVTLGPATIAVEPRQTGSWQFLTQAFDVNNQADVEAVGLWLAAVRDKPSTAARLSFVGTLSLAQKARLDEILEEHSAVFAALQGWERHADLAVRPDAGDLDDLGLSGFAAAALADLQAEATGEGEAAEIAQDALSLLYRLARRPA